MHLAKALLLLLRRMAAFFLFFLCFLCLHIEWCKSDCMQDGIDIRDLDIGYWPGSINGPGAEDDGRAGVWFRPCGWGLDPLFDPRIPPVCKDASACVCMVNNISDCWRWEESTLKWEISKEAVSQSYYFWSEGSNIKVFFRVAFFCDTNSILAKDQGSFSFVGYQEIFSGTRDLKFPAYTFKWTTGIDGLCDGMRGSGAFGLTFGVLGVIIGAVGIICASSSLIAVCFLHKKVRSTFHPLK